MWKAGDQQQQQTQADCSGSSVVRYGSWGNKMF